MDAEQAALEIMLDLSLTEKEAEEKLAELETKQPEAVQAVVGDMMVALGDQGTRNPSKATPQAHQ